MLETREILMWALARVLSYDKCKKRGVVKYSRESEVFIVATNSGNSEGAKGHR
jgi:hypothetical protein